MRTLVLNKPGRLALTDTPAPADPGPGQALVRVHRVGVCGTDIHAFGGNQPFFTYPRILGHELGVEVVAVGEGVANVAPGDRAAVEPYLNCGTCAACARGCTNCCETLTCMGVHGDGGMRERILVPAQKLHVSKTLTLDQLALVETMGIGKHAVDRAFTIGGFAEGDTVAVIGLGSIGLTAVQFALLAGARVVGVDLSATRCETAKRLYPALDTASFDPAQPIEAQWAARLGDAPRAVFDATGHRGSMQSAFALPGPGGTLVFIGLVLGDITFDDPAFHKKELTLPSSRNAVAKDFLEIIQHMEAGRIDVAPWITHRADAADWPGVFDRWLAPDAGLLKGMVSF